METEVRELIAYGLIGAVVLAGGIAYVMKRRRDYWRQLRMAGNSEAKRRELRR